MPQAESYDGSLLKKFDIEKEVIIAIRSLRQEKNIPNKEKLELLVKKNYNEEPDTFFDSIVMKMSGLESLSYAENKPEGALSFVVKSTEFFVPLSGHIDTDAEIEKLEGEIEYTKGFLNTVMKKLNNERFVSNAPEKVVAMEKKKRDDAEAKIKVLEEQLKSLKG
jgi:valyl-tRNA synthetase